LSLPAGVRAAFSQGGVDPRLVSVLGNAVAHHTIVVGGMEAVVDPVHAQSVDIVSVDGEPVGPGNVAARDLVTEIAALDPSVRPSEIGTPWPIQSQGFFSGPGQQAQLHLAFVSPADYQAGAGAGGVGVGGVGGVADGAQLAQQGPVAATPAAQGAAQALNAQLAAESAPPVQAVQPVVQQAAPAEQLVGQGTPAAVDGITGAASTGAAVPGWTSSQHAVAALLFKTFTSADLSPAGASAIIGNWMQESSLNPSEPGGFLAQWGGSRLSELTSQYGPNPSAAQQAQFALQELRGGYPSLLEQLKTTNDPRAAALAVSNLYERPDAALANNANREAQAAAALAAFGTTQGPTQTPAAQVADVAQSPVAAAPQPPQSPGVQDVGSQGQGSAPAGGAQELAAQSQVAPSGQGSAGGYVNPLPADARLGRTDQGVDANLKPGEPIVAIGRSRVLGVLPNWYEGQPYVALQLLDGPMQGHNYYLAEQITPAVSVGQIVNSGQPIAHYAASGTGIEIGWAGPNWEQTLAQATGRDNANIDDHANTPAGISFRDFLNSLPAAGASGSSSATGAAAAADVASAGGTGTAGAADSAATAGTPETAAGAASPDVAGGAGQEGGALDTAAFKASKPHEPHFHRHTVQFLATVQPGPDSPLFAQQAAAGQPGQAADVAGATPGQRPGQVAAGLVGQQQPGQVAGVVGQQQPGQAAEVVQGQGAGIVPEGPGGGSITVTSSHLTPGQAKFAGRLAQLTGLDPRVVSAWELAEESGSFARAREAASNFNWLNIGYFDSGAGKIAFDKAFSDPISAAEQTARFLKGTWGGASPSIRAILSTVNQGPQQQIMAIANSNWASSHYGGGANLRGTFDELSDIQIARS
jgi:hypothetical protein